jgi:type I site-specific restriction endonuclease
VKTLLDLYVSMSSVHGRTTREFTTENRSADCVLFVRQKVIGLVKAKPEGTTLSSVTDCEVGGILQGQLHKEVRDNPRLPVKYYDFIITDECYSLIYNQ